MSLVKKLNLSEKQLTANQNNGKLSHGPLTAEGRERIRAAQRLRYDVSLAKR